MPPITPLVRNLLILNVVIFFLETPGIINLFALHPILSESFKPHQFISYMFLHADFNHLLSNMLGLFFFGPLLEQHVFGPKRFAIFYLVTGIGAGILYAAINYIEVTQAQAAFNDIPMLGASGAVFGILAAFGLIFPNMEMMLLFIPVPIKAKYLITVYALYEIYASIYMRHSGVAHFAHVAGMIFAYILLKWWRIKKMY